MILIFRLGTDLARPSASFASMLREVDHFYSAQKEPAKSCLLALRKIILDQDAKVSETVKYGMPCFCYGKTMFCYLWTDKKSAVMRTAEPYMLFVEGKHLQHPELETGDRARMKILRVDPDKDIPIDRIRVILSDALDLYRNGIVKARFR